MIGKRTLGLTGASLALAALFWGIRGVYVRYQAEEELWKAMKAHDVRGYRRVLDRGVFNARAKGRLLLQAAEQQWTPGVKLLLQRGAPMDEEDYAYALTAFQHACRHGDAEMVRLLLDRGARQGSLYNWRPLHEAASWGNAGVVAFLIRRGFAVNERPGEVTPLMSAAASDHDGGVEAARLLLAAGAQVNARDSEGKTALWYAYTDLFKYPEDRPCLALVRLLKAHGGRSPHDRR